MSEAARTTAAVASSLISVERLEWGKLCQSHDGPIVLSSEHRVLGRSRGFPAELEDLCHPDQIGPVAGEEDFEPAEYPHGTVLRPVVRRGQITPVLARVRQRPEDGEGGRARLYYLARYLAAGTPGHDPLVLFSALESQPLAGLTQAEATSLDPLLATAEPPPVDGCTPFLGQALVYALSGVPMTITEPLPERTFFEWVTALWWLLPAPLRPLLSCGWGVAWPLSGRLLIVHSSEAARNAALYSPRDGSWRAPALTRLGHGETEHTEEFSDQRLIPGRMYAHLAFGFTERALRLDGPGERSDAAALVPPLDMAKLPLQPDLLDPAAVRALRRPGLEAFDAYRLAEAERWLETGETVLSEPLPAFSDGLTYRRTRARAAAAALAALATPNGARARAESLLWRLLDVEPGARDEIARAAGPGAARGHLLRVLSGWRETEAPEGDLLELLLRLRQAAERGEAGPLPDEARTRLVAALDRSLEQLDARLADAHALLLRAPRLADDYEPWLRRRIHDLLFGLGRWQPPEIGAALIRLGALLAAPGIDALGHWFMGHLPDQGDAEALAALPAAVRDRLARFLTEAWERPGRRPAEARERILAWCRIQPPAASQDALLHLALGGEGEPTPGEVDGIAREVERGAVPPSLLERIAVLTLDHWALLGERLRQQTAAWGPIIERLPRTIAYLVFESSTGVALNAAPEPLRRAYSHFTPSSEEVRDLLARWVPRLPLQQIDSRDAASALWSWTVASRSRPVPELDAVEVCRALERGDWAPGETLAAQELEKVRRLAVAAGKLPELAGYRDALWQGSSRLWQLHLALDLFSGDPLEPSALQLERLRADQEWIRRHLDQPDLHPRRHEVLRPALLKFHEVRYPGGYGVTWNDALSHTVLWAVFEGVPFDRQGSLAAALQAFADSPAERTRLAARYIDAHPEDPAEAARRVAANFVQPLLQEAALSSRQCAGLVSRLAGLRGRPPARGTWARLWQRMAEVWPWRRTIEVVEGRGESPAVARTGERRITLSPSLRRLLERLLGELGEERLRRELTGR